MLCLCLTPHLWWVAPLEMAQTTVVHGLHCVFENWPVFCCITSNVLHKLECGPLPYIPHVATTAPLTTGCWLPLSRPLWASWSWQLWGAFGVHIGPRHGLWQWPSRQGRRYYAWARQWIGIVTSTSHFSRFIQLLGRWGGLVRLAGSRSGGSTSKRQAATHAKIPPKV